MEIEKKNCFVKVGWRRLFDYPISKSKAELIQLEYMENGYVVKIEEI